ncbi:echinoidin-like [Amphiura filiformis]|uniref:echinoidin-like n=1 Tax=Amphiura filiformis TaxID=82378 RepID=UPI003B220884
MPSPFQTSLANNIVDGSSDVETLSDGIVAYFVKFWLNTTDTVNYKGTMFSLPILVIFGLISTVSSTCCPDYWTVYGDSCYQYFAVGKEWGDAESYCVGLFTEARAHLVGINDKDENDFVSNLIAGPQNTGRGENAWIGLNDIGHENSWSQVDGSSADYKNWDSGEPNDDGGEDCGETNHDGRGLWNDRSCTKKQHFVCEKPGAKSG